MRNSHNVLLSGASMPKNIGLGFLENNAKIEGVFVAIVTSFLLGQHVVLRWVNASHETTACFFCTGPILRS